MASTRAATLHATPEERLVGTEAVARHLGFNESWIRALVATDRIPYWRFYGRGCGSARNRLEFDVGELERWRPEPDLVGDAAAAQHLGIGRVEVLRLMRGKRGQAGRLLPAHRVGGLPWFRLSELDQWRADRAHGAEDASQDAAALAVPRPRTLLECGQEAHATGAAPRRCPWVSCRHHLLLEVASPKVQQRKDPRATTVRLNMARRDRVRLGRRPGLEAAASELEVLAFVDDAVELLSRMRYTCTFDVVRDYPDGLTSRALALVLGLTSQAIEKELALASQRHREELARMGLSQRLDSSDARVVTPRKLKLLGGEKGQPAQPTHTSSTSDLATKPRRRRRGAPQ